QKAEYQRDYYTWEALKAREIMGFADDARKKELDELDKALTDPSAAAPWKSQPENAERAAKVLLVFEEARKRLKLVDQHTQIPAPDPLNSPKSFVKALEAEEKAIKDARGDVKKPEAKVTAAEGRAKDAEELKTKAEEDYKKALEKLQ